MCGLGGGLDSIIVNVEKNGTSHMDCIYGKLVAGYRVTSSPGKTLVLVLSKTLHFLHTTRPLYVSVSTPPPTTTTKISLDTHSSSRPHDRGTTTTCPMVSHRFHSTPKICRTVEITVRPSKGTCINLNSGSSTPQMTFLWPEQN